MRIRGENLHRAGQQRSCALRRLDGSQEEGGVVENQVRTLGKFLEGGLEEIVGLVELGGGDVDTSEPFVDGLAIVVGAGAGEDVCDGGGGTVGDFEVEEGEPDVEFFGFFVGGDVFEGAFGGGAGGGGGGEGEVVGDVLEPEVGGVGVGEEEALEVGGGGGGVGVEGAGVVNVDSGFAGFLLFLGGGVGGGGV